MPWVYGIEAYSNNAFAQLCRLDVYLAKGGCIHLFILIIHGIKIIAIINIKYIIRFFAVLVNNLMQIFSAFAQLLLSKQKNSYSYKIMFFDKISKGVKTHSSFKFNIKRKKH